MTAEIVEFMITAGYHMQGNSIRNAIHRLRLGHPEGNKIQTVRNYGYFFKDEGECRVEAKDERYR